MLNAQCVCLCLRQGIHSIVAQTARARVCAAPMARTCWHIVYCTHCRGHTLRNIRSAHRLHPTKTRIGPYARCTLCALHRAPRTVQTAQAAHCRTAQLTHGAVHIRSVIPLCRHREEGPNGCITVCLAAWPCNPFQSLRFLRQWWAGPHLATQLNCCEAPQRTAAYGQGP